MGPLVSIITPTFNSEKFIEAAIASLQAQTHTNWEMILVDDASTDGTVKIITSATKKDSRLKCVQLSNNHGAGVARNTGIELAKGTYIAFLDADDLWMPEKLEKQLAFMKAHKAAVSYTSYCLIDENGTPMHKKVVALPLLTPQKMLKANYIGNLTGMYNVQMLGKVFMPTLRKRQDWALWYRCIQMAGKAQGLQEVLACYRVRNASVSSNKLNLLTYNYLFYRKACNFGAFKSTICLIRFLVEHFFVKSAQTIKYHS